MECGRFSTIRKQLNDLGYYQTLHPESVSLVEKVLADLSTTTENLQKYMKISQQALEERDNLELGAEPYKCDNAKLIKECNDLHLAFINFKEQHEKIQRDLRTQIKILENKLESCDTEKEKLKNHIQGLEKEITRLNRKGTKTSQSTLQEKTSGKTKSFELNTAMACADERIGYLSGEVNNLKEQQLRVIENNEFLKNQLCHRDDEIKRLNALLEGGRSSKDISKDCCYKNIDNKLSGLQDEVNSLKRDKNILHNQLKESLAKQHEAMRRALHLAERNKQLEKEMKDIDQIALAVEAECNSTVKDNAEKVSRLQDRINESLIVIQNLERENSKLKQLRLELSADVDAIKMEKKHLQSLLDNEIGDKKRLSDRVNSFTIIEHDLNMEIDRLMRLSADQKRKIVELECQVSTGKVQQNSYEFRKPEVTQAREISSPSSLSDVELPSRTKKSTTKGSQTSKIMETSPTRTKTKKDHKKTSKKSSKSKSPPSKTLTGGSRKNSVDMSAEKLPKTAGLTQKCCCEEGSCVKNLRELLDKEMGYRQTQAMQSIESLKQEKEYYMKEYHKLLEDIRNIRNVPSQDQTDKCVEFIKKLEEKEQVIMQLQRELRTLSQEKEAVIWSNSKTSINDDLNATTCNKAICKRREREAEMLRNDLKHTQVENDTLKSKIQVINESTVFNEDRMKKAFQEMEEHIRKLENERRDLVQNQLTSRSSLSHIEEEYASVKEQLRQTQLELTNQKANYNQLKNLHDQTDRALSEAQNKLLRAESELASFQARLTNTSRESVVYDQEIARLNADIQVMKVQLSKIDKEKDELLNVVDDKTEKIAMLEDQLKAKSSTISSLESELKELRRKVGKYSEETSSQDQVLRSTQQELCCLQKECEREKKLKDSAIQENRRLQDDLTSVTCDCRDARNELEICRRQVEDLKRQLQHYVAEVKRTEDLISHKELERNEILDQFKSISQEANILESNNHTLENEATQSKIQLSVALDHAAEMERRVDNQEEIIRSYEKQIAGLTSQVASLEIQMRQTCLEQERGSAELKQMRDLCVKLDQEKDNLKRELLNREDSRSQVDRGIERLTKEKESLQNAIEKERNNLDGVEKLLNEARQEVIEQRLLNQDLQGEVDRLKVKIDELQVRLRTTSEQLDLYQEKALEYSQLNKQLRRDIANERFSRSRDDDRRYPSL